MKALLEGADPGRVGDPGGWRQAAGDREQHLDQVLDTVAVPLGEVQRPGAKLQLPRERLLVALDLSHGEEFWVGQNLASALPLPQQPPVREAEPALG